MTFLIFQLQSKVYVVEHIYVGTAEVILFEETLKKHLSILLEKNPFCIVHYGVNFFIKARNVS